MRDSLPKVLEAMATMLSQSEVSDVKTLVDASLEHGVARAEQGFEPSEIAREYRLLRSILFSTLETDLLQGSPKEILRAVRLIDLVIDEAIALKSIGWVRQTRPHPTVGAPFLDLGALG